MRLQFLKTLFILAIVALISSIASAQVPEEELCYPDCTDSPWLGYGSSNHYTNLNCGPGCQVRIWYVYRSACNNQYDDVQITRIEFVSGNCSACDYGGLIREAIIRLMSQASAFPPLKLGDCTEKRRVSVAGCWKIVSSYSQQVGAIRPCLAGSCCMARYRVCKDNLGQITIETLDSPTVTPPCENDPESVLVTFPFNPFFNDVTESPCSTVCNDLGIDLYKPARGSQIGRSNDVQITGTGSTTVIICIPETDAAGILEIYSVSGSRIAEIYPTLTGDREYLFSIDKSKLPHGIYYYQVVFDGKRFTSGEIQSAR